MLREPIPHANGAARPLAADVAGIIPASYGELDSAHLLALGLLAHISSAAAGHVVIVGAGFGRTSLVLGATARATRRGRVFAIDLFPDGEDTGDPLGWTLDGFLGEVTGRGLIEYVLPHHGTAASFARLMPKDFRCGLLVLENAHACTEVASDLVAIERHLAPGGWLCVDSGFSSFPGAGSAIEALLRRSGAYELGRQVTQTLFAIRKRA